MGVEHYLVDDTGKAVLDCHKWYDLSPADEDDVTDAEISAASGRYDWLPAVAIRWRREVCGGRRLRLALDTERGPWLDDAWERMDGWRLYTPWNQHDEPPAGWITFWWGDVDSDGVGR